VRLIEMTLGGPRLNSATLIRHDVSSNDPFLAALATPVKAIKQRYRCNSLAALARPPMGVEFMREQIRL
jgi:hypothetical protein